MGNSIKVKKHSGELVDFDIKKLKTSLRFAKADPELIDEISNEVVEMIHDGMSTQKIYQLAYRRLKKKSRGQASRYKLKRAIMELGPTGYPFEQYVAALFKEEGFDTEVGVTIPGKRVNHEVDVVLCKGGFYEVIECKYHNQQGRVNDVKIPLYIQSRYMDIKENQEHHWNQEMNYKQGWIFTNTRFSLDAIAYAEGVGLNLVGWDYPKDRSLKARITQNRLYPVTALTTINKFEKSKLLESGVVLCKEIHQNPELLNVLQLSNRKRQNILNNVKNLSNNVLK